MMRRWPRLVNLCVEEAGAEARRTVIRDEKSGRVLTFTLKPEFVRSVTDLPHDRLEAEFHTEWSDGHVHAAGFTTAWPPNKAIIGKSFYPGMDLDLNGKNEENGGPTFSAINARSYHPGGVNTLLGDGSVRFVKSTIDGMVWRSVGTVAGGEVLSAESFYTSGGHK